MKANNHLEVDKIEILAMVSSLKKSNLGYENKIRELEEKKISNPRT